MYFITETELRLNYRKAHFTEYTIRKGTRLTPEARQFLMDRNISFGEENKQRPSSLAKPHLSEMPATRLPLPVKCKLEKLSASFLLMISFLVQEDLYTAEIVMTLEKQITHLIESAARTKEEVTAEPDIAEPLPVHHVSSFHVQLPNGREIALLNMLLADVQLLCSELAEQSEAYGKEASEQLLLTVAGLERISHDLQMLIHKAIGGGKTSEKE